MVFILNSRTAADFSLPFLYFPPMNMCFLCYQKKNNNKTKVTSMWQLTLSKSFMWICVKLLWLPTNLGTGSGSQNKGEPSYQRQSRVGSVTGLLLLQSHFSHVRLCDPMDCILPGSSGHGILQVSILEWIAISRGSSPPRDQTHDPCISCTGRLIPLPLSHLGSPLNYTLVFNCPPGMFFKIICSRRPVFPQSITDQYSDRKHNPTKLW